MSASAKAVAGFATSFSARRRNAAGALLDLGFAGHDGWVRFSATSGGGPRSLALDLQFRSGLVQFRGFPRQAVFQSELHLLQFRFQFLGGGDVPKGNHHAIDAVVHRAVRHDARAEPSALARADRFFHEAELAQDFTGIITQLGIKQIARDVGNGSAHIARDEVGDLRGLRGETPDLQLLVEENGGHLGAVEQVPHVVVGSAKARRAGPATRR